MPGTQQTPNKWSFSSSRYKLNHRIGAPGQKEVLAILDDPSVSLNCNIQDPLLSGW